MCMILLLPSGVSGDLTLYLLQISQLKKSQAGRALEEAAVWLDRRSFVSEVKLRKENRIWNQPVRPPFPFHVPPLLHSNDPLKWLSDSSIWSLRFQPVEANEWVSGTFLSQSTSWLQQRTLNINVELSVGRVNWRRLFNRGNYIYLHEHHPRGHDFVSSNYRTIISAKTMPQRMCFRIIACTDYAEVLIR